MKEPNAITGYKYKDLLASGIIANRTDLMRKQRRYKFPRPVKLGIRQTWWPHQAIADWLAERQRQSPK